MPLATCTQAAFRLLATLPVFLRLVACPTIAGQEAYLEAVKPEVEEASAGAFASPRTPHGWVR